MRCSKCGTETLPGKRYCTECGGALPLCCPRCGLESSPAARFCANCGAALTSAAQLVPLQSRARSGPGEIRIAPEQLDSVRPLDGERKTVTALFADIKGSMELIEDLDPEEARAIIDPALKLMFEAVERYDGYIVQSTGDGVFALFGAPVAHEDHPQRALYTALRMQEDLKRYSDQTRAAGRPPIQVRVGINTGEVVVRNLRTGAAQTEYTPVGHSTSLAARMQALAPIGSIATTEQVRKICEGYFILRPLGPARIKGVAEPVNVFEVTGLGALRTHFQVSVKRGLTKFVGRRDELEQMKRALESARDGRGGVIATAGEPGVGKSRLLYEFKAVAGADCKVLETFAVSHATTSSYLPVIELLKGYFEIGASDDDRRRREKVNGKIITLDRSLEDTLPYLFTLLGLNVGEDPLVQMNPQIKRRRTQDAVKRLLLRESLNQPLIVIFEDLHWIDGETQGLLNLLVDNVAEARILLLVNYRPEYRHEWGGRAYYAEVRLHPLGRQNAEQMLSAILGEQSAGNERPAQSRRHLAQLMRLVIERTEGNPFFMEEMVQALFEEGVLRRDGALLVTRPPTQVRVPATVQAVLASRIDRLPANDKDLLHTLAVLGRQFPLGLVRQVAQSSDELEQMLLRLQVGEFIFEQAAIPEVGYTFKHALTQEVAYNSILIKRRKLIHERAAQAIEELYPAHLEDHYGSLAYHYGHSSNTHKAVEYLRLAGQQALQRSANADAISHLTAGLELVRSLPEADGRAQQELVLQIALGAVLVAAEGYTTPAVKNIYTRAHELCRQAGDARQLFSVLNGLRRFHYLRTEFTTAREYAEQLLSLAQRENDPALLVLAHQAAGVVAYSQAQLSAAREHLELAPALYDPRQHHFHTLVYGENPSIIAKSFETWVLWLLGYPEQALEKSQQALSLAGELSHPLTSALALNFAAWLHQLRGEQAALRERTEAAISVASEQGLPYWLAQATILAGWMRSREGEGARGVEQMHEGLAAIRATGATLTTTYFLALLADAYAKTGRTEQGLNVLAEALDLAEVNGERFYEAELHRLRGELLLQGSRVSAPDSVYVSRNSQAEAEAEGCFRKAIDIASRQQARSLELRSVMSLCRLRSQQGRRAEAQQMLGGIYGWFTEGFATADLQQAKMLLDELAP